jgi:FHA domain
VAGETLNVISGEAAGESVALNGELVIGRSTPELAALAHDTEISRVHARVWRGPGGMLLVEDLGSRNGTFVNGVRIEKPRLLEPGDELRAGRTTMELVEGDAPSYDALVEEEEEPPARRRERGSARVWPVVAVAALIAGGGIGAAIAGSRTRLETKTDTLVVTHKVTRPAPPQRLAAPRTTVQLGTVPGPAARETFAQAFCGGAATAPRGTCACTYDELVRTEPYAQIVAQAASSTSEHRLAPEIISAARACGAS